MTSSVQVLNVKLQRADRNVSWGFNVQGGVEFGAPLCIARVNHNGLADKAQVQQGDFVLRIGSASAERMSHAQAREAILNQGDYLEMTLQRGASPRSDDYSSRYDFPQHQLMNPNNFERVPVASPQVGLQLGGNRALLTQSYNSPMGLYSSRNMADTLVNTLNNLNVNDPKLYEAAQHIKPKPDLAPQPAQHHYHQPQPVSIKVNPPNVSKASITLKKPISNNNDNSVGAYGYMQPAMYHQQAPPQSFGNYHPPQPQQQQQQQQFSNYQKAPAPYYPTPQPPPPPQPRPIYSPPPSAPLTQRRQITRGNRGAAMYNSTSNSVPTCASCCQLIRGPFISAVGKIWCPGHFVCSQPGCGMSLHDVGFVEEGGRLYCEKDFENYFAPTCTRCRNRIIGECCYALDKTYHPECFTCGQCGSFHIEDGVIYCSRDFAAMFSVKCAGCEFPIEPLDKFFEALGQKYHTECFICSQCNVPLNGSYVAKGNKPYCKRHGY